MQEMSYDRITETCLEAFGENAADALGLLERLMNQPGVPMHDPVHHYIMPALLLTLAAVRSGKSREELARLLQIAEERARKLLPGFCGWWGACGSAVGCGVFASVWSDASPKREEHWAQANAFTAKCLANVSSVGGPRCCKRTSYLSLQAAIPAAAELFNLDLGEIPKPVCSWSQFNKECRHEGCPFYQKDKNIKHENLVQRLETLHKGA